MSRQGKRIFFATESVDFKTVRRFELASSARIRLYFPSLPYGNLEQRRVTYQRFVALFTRKDKRQPQPVTFKSPFIIAIRNQRITELTQKLP
jgi:hypothetical protein